MIEHSPTITKLMTALHQVQGEVEGVAKNKINPHLKNRYADLEAVVDALRPACQSAGIVVIQAPGVFINNCLSVETMLVHAESGEFIKSAVQMPLGKADPQGCGSAISYARRYSLMSMLALPATDDDAEAATRPNGVTRPTPPQSPTHGGERASSTGATPAYLTGSLAQVMKQEIDKAPTSADVAKLMKSESFIKRREALPADMNKEVGEYARRRYDDLRQTDVVGAG